MGSPRPVRPAKEGRSKATLKTSKGPLETPKSSLELAAPLLAGSPMSWTAGPRPLPAVTLVGVRRAAFAPRSATAMPSLARPALTRTLLGVLTPQRLPEHPGRCPPHLRPVAKAASIIGTKHLLSSYYVYYRDISHS